MRRIPFHICCKHKMYFISKNVECTKMLSMSLNLIQPHPRENKNARNKIDIAQT